MRHSNSNRKFGLVKNKREALLRGLVRSAVLHEKIQTTEAKAKELRPILEKLVTQAAGGTLASTRAINSKIGDPEVSRKLINEIAPKYKERNGGYTRITKLPARKGDASPQAIIEFV